MATRLHDWAAHVQKRVDCQAGKPENIQSAFLAGLGRHGYCYKCISSVRLIPGKRHAKTLDIGYYEQIKVSPTAIYA